MGKQKDAKQIRSNEKPSPKQHKKKTKKNEQADITNSQYINNNNIPKVLTQSSISELAVLHAGDVVECYYLTRTAQLHTNSNAIIQITKVALGLRHRPAVPFEYDTTTTTDTSTSSSESSTTTAAAAGVAAARPLELTMEYGGSRAGDVLQHESIPVLLESDTAVSWDNQAKIYYTERIDSSIYTTANYLASVSGVVLQELLTAALDYSNSQRHRRYQPFAVYYNNKNDNNEDDDGDDDDTAGSSKKQQLLLKSSNDVDFLQHLYETLAMFGVELKPVIAPVTRSVVLHAASPVQKVALSDNTNVRTASAHFYQNLYACLNAIATANYSAYEQQHDQDHLLPSPAPAAEPPRIRQRQRQRRRERRDKIRDPLLENGSITNKTTTTTTTVTTASPSSSSSSLSSRAPSAAAAAAPIPTAQLVTAPSPPSSAQTTTMTLAPTATVPAPTGSSSTTTTHSEQAAEAAEQAQQAATAAGNATNTQQAVDAAQKAATAAQKAADATTQQAAAMAQAALRSNDGDAVVRTIATTCFENELYGLTTKTTRSSTSNSNNNNNNNNTNDDPAAASSFVEAYLYWDGAFYYRVNLTAPYVSIAQTVTTMPQPPVMGIGAEDFVDWALALVLFCVAAFGFLMLLQQVMGRNLKVIPPLYRYQRWFFHPTKYNLDELDDESENNAASRGLGQEYTFGEDVIPLSMGGRRAGVMERAELWLSSTGGSINNNNGANGASGDLHASESGGGGGAGLGDMELVDRSSSIGAASPLPRRLRVGSNGNSFERGVSFHSATEDDDDLTDHAPRLFRDPNLVDLPDLKSKTKVAVPVSVSFASNSSGNNNNYDESTSSL